MKNGNLAVALIVAVVVTAVSLLGCKQVGLWLTVKTQTVKNEAVDQCLKSATYNTETVMQMSGVKTNSNKTNKKWYEYCMREKGYKK